MTTFRVAFVDVYVLRRGVTGLEALILRRAPGVRCTGAWETVHGSIEAGETPVMAARRELEEETGLRPAQFYNLSRVESFYRHAADEIGFIPVFAALVESAPVRLVRNMIARNGFRPRPPRRDSPGRGSAGGWRTCRYF